MKTTKIKYKGQLWNITAIAGENNSCLQGSLSGLVCWERKALPVTKQKPVELGTSRSVLSLKRDSL